jgi:hypothetical protein
MLTEVVSAVTGLAPAHNRLAAQRSAIDWNTQVNA